MKDSSQVDELVSHVSRVANETYGHSRPFMPEQPWWKNLDPVFHRFPDTFYLEWRAQLLVWVLSWLDVLVRFFLASAAVTGALFSTLRRLKEDDRQRHFYAGLADAGEREQIFVEPAFVPLVHRRQVLSDVAPAGAVVEDLRFDSRFEVINPALAEHYARFKRNNVVHAQYWHHGDGPRPTLIIAHGFMLSSYRVNARFFSAGWFFRQGYDVILSTQPFHGWRREKWAPFSGHGVFSYGISHVNEMFAQSVFDFRSLLNWLDSQGVRDYGVTGISLGGYLSALLAATEKRLAFSIPVVPVASLTDVMFQWAPAGWLIRGGLRLVNISVQEARHSGAATSPLTWAPLLDKSRLMVIGGAGDRIVPPKHARLLWDHWQQPLMHWFPGNHLVHVDQGRYLRQMAAFMRGLGFAPQKPAQGGSDAPVSAEG